MRRRPFVLRPRPDAAVAEGERAVVDPDRQTLALRCRDEGGHLRVLADVRSRGADECEARPLVPGSREVHRPLVLRNVDAEGPHQDALLKGLDKVGPPVARGLGGEGSGFRLRQGSLS